MNSRIVIPAQAGIQENQAHGLFASLAFRANFQSFNALRAFVRPAPEERINQGWYFEFNKNQINQRCSCAELPSDLIKIMRESALNDTV